jgi:hypothetical protein
MPGIFDEPEQPPRRTPTLQDLRADLAAAAWNDDLKPAFEPIPHPSLPQKQKQGFFGEDLMARTAASRGEIILDYGSGIEDTNKGGADLVTLAEKDGQLCVTLYDNKAVKSDAIRSVTALRANRDANIEALKEKWQEVVADERRAPSEVALFQEALSCLNDHPPRIDLVVTNHNSLATRLSSTIEAEGIRFEDMAGNTDVATNDAGGGSPGLRLFK